jgi:hypothetical protein
MNIERDVNRADARARRRQRLAADLDLDLVADETVASAAMPGLLLRDVVRHAGQDGRIVVSVAVEGFSQVEIAGSLGLSEAATRKRYQRAVRRLRTAFSRDMSRSALPAGLSASGAPALVEKEGIGPMPCIDEAEDLTRLPGLFRRWEFSDVLETRRTYRLGSRRPRRRDAAHCDLFGAREGQRDRLHLCRRPGRGGGRSVMHPVDTVTVAKPVSMTSEVPHLTLADLERWFSTVEPGGTLLYHRGFLAMDRGAGSRLGDDTRRELDRVAAAAMAMAEAGYAHLIQQRHGMGDYSYMVVASSPGRWRRRGREIAS